MHGRPDGSEPFPKGTTAELDPHPIRPSADTAPRPPDNAPQKTRRRLSAIRVGIPTSSDRGYPFMAHSFGLRITINRWAPIINRSIWPKHDDHASLTPSIAATMGTANAVLHEAFKSPKSNCGSRVRRRMARMVPAHANRTMAAEYEPMDPIHSAGRQP